MKLLILVLSVISLVSCSSSNVSIRDSLNPILTDYLGSDRVETILMAASVRPVIVADSRGKNDPRPKAGPFVIVRTLEPLNQVMAEKIKKTVLDINIYNNQRQYLYTSKEIAESKMSYDLCIFEPKYAFEFKNKSDTAYFFISSSCEKIGHSYKGDFISEDIYSGAISDFQHHMHEIFSQDKAGAGD